MVIWCIQGKHTMDDNVKWIMRMVVQNDQGDKSVKRREKEEHDDIKLSNSRWKMHLPLTEV